MGADPLLWGQEREMELRRQALEEERRRREQVERRLQSESARRQQLVEKEVKMREKQFSQARPLPRYVPVPKEDFDLKTHVECRRRRWLPARCLAARSAGPRSRCWRDSVLAEAPGWPRPAQAHPFPLCGQARAGAEGGHLLPGHRGSVRRPPAQCGQEPEPSPHLRVKPRRGAAGWPRPQRPRAPGRTSSSRERRPTLSS